MKSLKKHNGLWDKADSSETKRTITVQIRGENIYMYYRHILVNRYLYTDKNS